VAICESVIFVVGSVCMFETVVVRGRARLGGEPCLGKSRGGERPTAEELVVRSLV
jgi:hypothetical protein